MLRPKYNGNKRGNEACPKYFLNLVVVIKTAYLIILRHFSMALFYKKCSGMFQNQIPDRIIIENVKKIM